MDDSTSFVVFVGCLVLSAFFSATETAYFTLSPLRLKKLESEGDSKAAEMLKVLGDKQRMLMTLLMGNTFVNMLATAIATRFILVSLPSLKVRFPASKVAEWVSNAPGASIAAASLFMTIMLLIFGEITPKTVAIFGAYGYSRFVIKPLRFFIFLFYPFTASTIWFLKKFFPKFADWNSRLGSATSMEEIDSYFSLGEEVGIIESDEKEMINSVFEFGDTMVREVMVPRPDIEALPITASKDELFSFIKEDGHSRLPVYDGSIDKISGVLHVKDILIKLDDLNKSYDLSKLIRPAFFVPETKKLDDLLSEFQKRKQHMAIVVDEYGGIAGLVTIEDLLEEIVGEIVDEYDLEEQEPMSKIAKNVYSIDARYSISDLEEELDCTFDYEDSETVGGFVLEKLGRIPMRGESFEVPQGVFQVSEIKGNRILRVKFSLSPQNEAEKASKAE